MSSRIPCAIAVALAVVGAGAHADPLTASPADEPRYESGFDGYRADTEIELRDWRATNDRVRTIGGWRTYLKEAAEARPVVLVRGARLGRAECGSGSLLRERAMDLFR